MKHYQRPEWLLCRLPMLSVLTASGDPDEWETDIVPPTEDDYDPDAEE